MMSAFNPISFRRIEAFSALWFTVTVVTLGGCERGDTNGAADKISNSTAPVIAPSATATFNPDAVYPGIPEPWDPVYVERFSSRIGTHAAQGVVATTGPIAKRYSPTEQIPGAARYEPLPRANPNEISLDVAILDAATSYAELNNSKLFMVWDQDKIVSESYFDGTTRSTEMISYSMAKPLGVIAIGRALELGFIRSLDQPVADFITEWQDTPKAAITLRDALQMHTGLLAQSFSSAITKDPTDIRNQAYLGTDNENLIVNHYPLISEPGVRYDYSNVSAMLVAIVVQRATKQRYADFLSQHLLTPLGALGGSVWVDRAGGLAHSGCCTMLPAETWMRLGVLLLNDGHWDGKPILPAGFVDEMKKPSPGNRFYGMGVFLGSPYQERRGFLNPETGEKGRLHSAPYFDEDITLFDGNFNQVMYFVPSRNLVILRMGKEPREHPEWDNAYLPNLFR